MDVRGNFTAFWEASSSQMPCALEKAYSEPVKSLSPLACLRWAPARWNSLFATQAKRSFAVTCPLLSFVARTWGKTWNFWATPPEATKKRKKRKKRINCLKLRENRRLVIFYKLDVFLGGHFELNLIIKRAGKCQGLISQPCSHFILQTEVYNKTHEPPKQLPSHLPVTTKIVKKNCAASLLPEMSNAL